MPLKRQKTAVKRQRRNSNKTRRIRRRGGGKGKESIFTLKEEAKEYEREWLREDLDRLASINKYVTDTSCNASILNESLSSGTPGAVDVFS